MLGYQFFNGSGLTNKVPKINPVTNLSQSLYSIQRGKFQDYIPRYQPPPLDLYTQFSLQTYFFCFWGIILSQILTIFLVDKFWVKNIPHNCTIFERIIHAAEKASFPFPYKNWHQENGNCQNHVERKEAAQCEVLLSNLINLLFNMLLLCPLPILCKIYNMQYSSYTLVIINKSG